MDPNKLPIMFRFLAREDLPALLAEALKEYGTVETPGAGNNPKILGWADEVAVDAPSAYNRWASNWYHLDSTPWCGLFMAVCAVRSNPQHREVRMPPKNYLSAASWALWGQAASECHSSPVPSLGDILVFKRPGGHHVGIYVGHDDRYYYVLGGNQSDQVNITKIERSRCIAVRRPAYVNQPLSVRPIIVVADGPVSLNEA